MRIFFIFFATVLSVHSEEQDVRFTPFDKYTTTTIHLKDFKADKIVAYKYNSVTFYVDYNGCHKVFSDLLKRYNEDRDEEEDAESDRGKRRHVLDSTVKWLVSQVKKSDTVYLSQATFESYELDPLQDFLPARIENGTCAIMDNMNKRHFEIIRQKGSWHRDRLYGWGGRRYFLPGSKIFFIYGTDWIE